MSNPAVGRRTMKWNEPLTAEERSEMRGSLLGHGRGDEHEFRFWLLLLLSVVVAVMGLTLGSTAIVIGAMLIAPLMEPILASSYSIAVGSLSLTLRTLLKVVLASVAGFVLAAALAVFIPGETLTPEVLARTAPDLRDLVVAIAAGVAGAYASARRGSAAALPGVAVAVALVPPLATVGIAFEAGRWPLAQGAALLYTTNLLAITAAGVGVFALLGITPRASDTSRRRWSRVGFGATLVVVLVVGFVLFDQTAAIAERNNDLVVARASVESWLEGNSSLEIDDVSVDGRVVEVDLVGADQYPPIEQLAADLTGSLGDVEVRVRVAQRSVASSRDSPSPDEEAQRVIAELADAWIENSPRDRVVDVRVENASGVIEVEGPDGPPPVDVLAKSVSDAGYDVDLEVRWTQQRSLDAAELELQSKREQIRDLTTAWATAIDEDLTVNDVVLEDSTAVIDVAGPLVAADPRLLEADIKDVLNEDIDVEVRLTIRVPIEPPEG